MDDSTKDFIVKMQELLIKSEARIDRTNDMVCKCVGLVQTITQEYCKQLEKIQEARDTILKQNTTLIQMMQKSEDKVSDYAQKYDRLLDRVLSISGKSENNINVK